jgi:phytoene dehydrogenase-like protein
MLTATVIGSGPNGLSAAIVLAAAGLATTVFERNLQIGGACSTAETTLPNFRQDLGSSVYPMGVASPFFRSLPINIPWIEPTAPCAHPLDDGTAVMLEHSIEATVATLDPCDGGRYRSLIAPLASEFAELSEDILGPIQHIPRHALVLARFGASALLPAASLARSHFTGKRAQAFFAGGCFCRQVTYAAWPSFHRPGSQAVSSLIRAAGRFISNCVRYSWGPSPADGRCWSGW